MSGLDCLPPPPHMLEVARWALLEDDQLLVHIRPEYSTRRRRRRGSCRRAAGTGAHLHAAFRDVFTSRWIQTTECLVENEHSERRCEADLHVFTLSLIDHEGKQRDAMLDSA